jgi:hypothetical protein
LIETVTAPIETVTPLKPSEALRLGRLVYPKQCKGVEVGSDGVSACATGAMLAGGLARINWPDRRFRCPVCGMTMTFWGVVALCLNDIHDWSDAQIASWLESLGL